MSVESQSKSFLDDVAGVGMHSASTSLLVPPGVVSAMNEYLGLNITEDAAKARFVESCLFASAVLTLIAVAATKMV
jgi:hypothetical protein